MQLTGRLRADARAVHARGRRAPSRGDLLRHDQRPAAAGRPQGPARRRDQGLPARPLAVRARGRGHLRLGGEFPIRCASTSLCEARTQRTAASRCSPCARAASSGTAQLLVLGMSSAGDLTAGRRGAAASAASWRVRRRASSGRRGSSAMGRGTRVRAGCGPQPCERSRRLGSRATARAEPSTSRSASAVASLPLGSAFIARAWACPARSRPWTACRSRRRRARSSTSPPAESAIAGSKPPWIAPSCCAWSTSPSSGRCAGPDAGPRRGAAAARGGRDRGRARLHRRLRPLAGRRSTTPSPSRPSGVRARSRSTSTRSTRTSTRTCCSSCTGAGAA